MLKLIMIGLSLGLLLVGCGPAPSDHAGSRPNQGNEQQHNPVDGQAGEKPGSDIPPEQAKKLIETRSAEVIAAIKNKDLKKLQHYVHPEAGVRFSPYTYVDKAKDLAFKADRLETLLADKTVRTWGQYDGSGEPISLTFNDYYAKFIYNHDFAKAEKIAYNEFPGKGNTVNNIRDVYPQAITVEYYFSGFDKQFAGNDWASLRLVFEAKDNQWYLVGIVHDQWTI